MSFHIIIIMPNAIFLWLDIASGIVVEVRSEPIHLSILNRSFT